jgi:hypothetical protein
MRVTAARLTGYGQPPHTEEWHQTEPFDEGHLSVPADQEPGSRAGIYPAEIDRRSDIARYLPPHRFPADRDALLGCLEGTDAPDEVADAIAALPADRSFATVGDVARALGIPTEH